MSDNGKIKTLKSLPYETIRKLVKMGGCLQTNSISAWQVIFPSKAGEYYTEAANNIRQGLAEINKEPKVYEIATCLTPHADPNSDLDNLQEAFVRVLLNKIIDDKHVFGVLLDKVIQDNGWGPPDNLTTEELLEDLIQENVKIERKKEKDEEKTSKSEVSIKFDDIYWAIHAESAGEDDKNKLIKLSWGWTAGLREEQLKDYAEDAPQGHQSVITTLEFAKALRDQLDEIIKESEGEK